jgi:hypothetical protein
LPKIRGEHGNLLSGSIITLPHKMTHQGDCHIYLKGVRVRCRLLFICSSLEVVMVQPVEPMLHPINFGVLEYCRGILERRIK